MNDAATLVFLHRSLFLARSIREKYGIARRIFGEAINDLSAVGEEGGALSFQRQGRPRREGRGGREGTEGKFFHPVLQLWGQLILKFSLRLQVGCILTEPNWCNSFRIRQFSSVVSRALVPPHHAASFHQLPSRNLVCVPEDRVCRRFGDCSILRPIRDQPARRGLGIGPPPKSCHGIINARGGV